MSKFSKNYVMDATETDHNKNRTPLRKSSAIPRLHNKQNIPEASPENIEENAFNHPDGSPEKIKESRESCFCTNCYNKTKNLYKFTLNENLIRNLPNETDEIEVETGYNETEDDDINSAIIMTDGGSPRSEDNCVNQIRKQETDRFVQTSFTVEETTSSKPNPPRGRNYDKYQKTEYLPDTTIPTKEAKRIRKEIRKISTGSNDVKLRIRNDKSQKHPTSSERNNCAPVKVSSTKHADNIKSCLLKVKTRNHLKYTLTNVTNRHPHLSKKDRASFSKESSASSSRCVTPREINLQKTQENVLNVSKLLDESNFKNFENYSIQNQTNLFNASSNLGNYPCQPDNPLSHLFKTGNPCENNVSDVHADQPKNPEYANESTLEALPNTPKEIKRDCLMNALLEVFGGDSHITQKLRNSTITKCDSRFRNIRSAKSYNLNFDSNVVENKMKTYTCRNSPSIESNLCKKDDLQSDICKSDNFSSCTFSSLEKSLPETFSSAQMNFPKTLGNNYNQGENCISLKRCKCQNLKCHQLDELNESITSMQTEIKTLIKSLPCGIRCTCTISDEIIKLKQFYHECQQNELKRNLQQKKLEYDIKEIYRRIDKLIEPKHNSFFFKYFVLLPLIGILAVYSVSCLGELKKN